MNRHGQLEKHGLASRPSGWVKRLGINRSDDDELAMAAVKAIECLTTVPVETINVTARNGWLHLEGTLTSGHQRTMLKDLTRYLPGVRGVTDSIMITSLPAQAEPRTVL